MCERGDRPYCKSHPVKVCPGECNPRQNKKSCDDDDDTENSWHQSKCGEAPPASRTISCLAGRKSRRLECPRNKRKLNECPKMRKCHQRQMSKQTLYMLIFLMYVSIQGISAFFLWDDYWYQLFVSTQVCGIVVLACLRVTGTVPLPK